MLKFLKRNFQRYTKEVSLLVAISSLLIVFYKPLKLIYYDSEQEAFLEDPRRKKAVEEAQTRKELIIQKYKEYKECQDPEQKKQLYKELSQIHENRLKQYHRRAFEGTKDY